MKSDYLGQSLEATKEAIRYDVRGSEAMENQNHDLVRHCNEQAKHYRMESTKLLRKHNNEKV
jgi:hypothetical protein|tara:strand:+ start:29 stop:214 length:186 start_codon:yes stop_codon:yes gene_type:complete